MGQLGSLHKNGLSRADRLAPETVCFANLGSNGHRPQPADLPPVTPPLSHLRIERKEAGGDEPSAARMAERFAPRAQATLSGQRRPALAPHLLALAAGIRRLAAALVLVALLPNLTVALVLWLGPPGAPLPSSVSVPLSEPTPVRAARSAPLLAAPATLQASAGDSVALPIRLDGGEAMPARSVVVIGGLPPGSMLSRGRPYGDTEWTVKPADMDGLHLAVPETAAGDKKIMIQLVAPDDHIVAGTATLLKLTEPAAETAAHAISATLAEMPAGGEAAVELAALGGEARAATADAAMRLPASVPLPARRPAPSASGEAQTDWIEPLAYVNLRERPSPSGAVISVVAKGAKLRVIGRKPRWVQVADPATAQSGWIYAANVAMAD